MAKRIVARDLGVPVEALSRRLDALAIVLPELAARFDTMRAGDIARLAAVADPAASVVRLRTVFPAANVNRMIARRPELLLMDAGEVAERAAALRLLLPGIDADAAAGPSRGVRRSVSDATPRSGAASPPGRARDSRCARRDGAANARRGRCADGWPRPVAHLLRRHGTSAA